MNLSEFGGDDLIEREFEESGLQCCTRTSDRGHRCGYVVLPKGHPLFGKDGDECYDIVPNLKVDGGITFADGTDEMWILGWNAAHTGHKRDWSIASNEFRELRNKYPELYMDFGGPGDSYIVDANMAEQETRKFARQLAKLGKKESDKMNFKMKIKEEYKELLNKIEALDAFIVANEKRESSDITDEHYRMMQTQFHAMCAYEGALRMRIEDLGIVLDTGEG